MSPFRLWLTLGALSIPIILVSIDLNGIVVLLPQIGSDLGASADEVGSIVTVASITSCAPLLLVGRVATRVGSRRLLLFGIALLWIAAVICTFTESFSLMMFGRALEGLGAACCFTTSLAVIDYLFDSKRRPVAIGIWGGLGGLGGAVAPLVASLLIQAFSWRAFFGINLILLAVALVMLLILVPKIPADAARSIPVVIMGLLTLGIAGTIGGVQHSAFGGWLSAGTIIPIIGGAICLALVWRLRTPETPLVPTTITRKLSFRFGTAEATLSNWGSGVVMVLVPIALETIRGVSVLDAGIIFMAFSIPFALGSVISGSAIDTYGGQKTLGASSAVFAIGILVLVVVGITGPMVGIVVGLAICGLGNGVIYSGATSVSFSDIVSSDAAEASATLSMLRVSGFAMAVALSTSIAGSLDSGSSSSERGIRTVLIIAAVITAAGIPAAFRRGKLTRVD